MRNLLIGLILVLALLWIGACGEGAVTPDETGTVNIELTESAFEPSNIEVTAGTTVRFVLDNVGQEEHEFMIGRTVSRAPGFPDTFETDFFHGVKVDVAGDPLMVMAGEAVVTQHGEMAMEDEHGEMAMEDEHGEMAKEDEHGEMAKEDEHGEMAMDGGHDDMAMDADHGFMISQAAGADITVVTVEIPEGKVGVWEIGCFVDEGTHYEDGMKGTLTVLAP